MWVYERSVVWVYECVRWVYNGCGVDVYGRCVRSASVYEGSVGWVYEGSVVWVYEGSSVGVRGECSVDV